MGFWRQRDSKSQAVEGVGGGALQQRCKSCSLSLIGCFAVRMLRGEDEFASYRLGMLYKVSQEVFLETDHLSDSERTTSPCQPSSSSQGCSRMVN